MTMTTIKPLVSICIPTYNRAEHLKNCLNSIVLSKNNENLSFQVCVSDNSSEDETENVVRDAQLLIDIKYHKNSRNIGIARNFINVVSMADGDFVWLIGDDDLLLPNALDDLSKLIRRHQKVDFFYVNAFHLTTEYVFSFPKPFDTANLPKKMTPFSTWKKSGEMKFIELINPEVSFDFLGGMFLSVFRRENWVKKINVLDNEAIFDMRTFSHFDNTFPHIKIFSHAFSNSMAYFNVNPLCVCLTGAREWAPMYPFVHSVRLVEALSEYRKNGLPIIQYLRCKNYALNKFIPHFIMMLLNRERSGFAYIRPLRLIFENCIYPNFYLSIFYYFLLKFKLKLT